MQLFYKRFCDDWRNQVKTINWVIPPIIWIYIVSPISLLLGIYYYHIWSSTQLYWNEFIPLGVLYLVLFIFISPGNIRSYLLDADLIFLTQNPKVMTKSASAASWPPY